MVLSAFLHPPVARFCPQADAIPSPITQPLQAKEAERARVAQQKAARYEAKLRAAADRARSTLAGRHERWSLLANWADTNKGARRSVESTFNQLDLARLADAAQLGTTAEKGVVDISKLLERLQELAGFPSLDDHQLTGLFNDLDDTLSGTYLYTRAFE